MKKAIAPNNFVLTCLRVHEQEEHPDDDAEDILVPGQLDQGSCQTMKCPIFTSAQQVVRDPYDPIWCENASQRRVRL